MIDNDGNNLDEPKVFLVKDGIVGFGWVCAPKGWTQRQVQEAIWDHVPQYVPGSAWIALRVKSDDPELVSPGYCAECNNREHWLCSGGLSGFALNSLFGVSLIMEDQDPELHCIRADTLGYDEEALLAL